MRLASVTALALLFHGAACGGSGDTTSGAGSGGSSGGTAPLLVTTDKGPVEGVLLGDSRLFLGIPYAAPPVGALRWRPPAPHAPWTAPLEAKAVGPACAQLDPVSSTSFDPHTSEDCLTLNVWAPKKASAAPLPVMFWVHGGSFLIGSGGAKDYDGQKLSEATGAVVVTINYRLGPLGFLALAALHDEDPAHPSSGMYGFEDQRAALAWARDNIAAFGGDPENVTLFGESAGGISVCMHMVSPASKGLFQRAIIESGACALGRPAASETDAQPKGGALVTKLGCDGKDAPGTLACLRAKKPEEVLLALPTSPFNIVVGGTSWGPVVDGPNVPGDPTKLFASGGFQHVPTLLGTNADEGTLFFAFQSPVTDDASYQKLAEEFEPGHGADIVAHYPSSMYGSPKDAAAAAIGDAGFTCPARRVARALTGAGVPTYRYRFVHVPQSALLSGLGAFHSSEIPFVFGNSTQLEPKSPTAAEAPLATLMMGYWGRMAKSADPNGGGAATWPKYDATDPDLRLDLTPAAESGFKKADCDFWDGLSGP